MKQVFDLIEAINEGVMIFVEENGRTPSEVTISKGAYRRLLEIKSEESMIGNLLIGCSPIVEIDTPIGVIHLSIDELLSATEVAVF